MPVTVLYLGGFGRSGSTLVERILGAAPGWLNAGELVDLARSVARTNELCGCGRPFSTCPVWSEVGEQAFGGWSEDVLDRLAGLQRAAARQRHLPGLLGSRRPASPALAALRDAYARIYRSLAAVGNASVIVDASKGPALAQALAGSEDIDLRLLNVVRDPRAVAWSCMRRVERPHVVNGTQEMWRIPPHRSAAHWSALQLEVEAIEGLGRVRSSRLRYEDFVADPVAALVSATADLGLPLSAADLPPFVGGQVELSPSHGLSGNPGRFRSGALELRRDDGWIRDMPGKDKAVVTALTMPLLRRYGYPLAAGSAGESATPDHRHAGSST